MQSAVKEHKLNEDFGSNQYELKDNGLQQNVDICDSQFNYDP